MFKENNEKYINEIKVRLSEERFIHSLNVEKSARELALIYGADIEKSAIAAILHDILKDTPSQEQFKILKNSDISLTEVEKQSPQLWHAMAGMVFVRDKLDISEEDILNAIRYHTTGRAGMSLVEKVVFLADFISEDRIYNGVEQMRIKARRSIKEALTEALSFMIIDLVNRGYSVHPDTVDLYNEVLFYD